MPLLPDVAEDVAMTPSEAMTDEKRIELIAKLLLSQPWILVACGLGKIKGEDLAKHLLALSPNNALASTQLSFSRKP